LVKHPGSTPSSEIWGDDCAPFGDLVRRYAFRTFEWGSILFFGNSAADDPLNLHIAARHDRTIWQAARQAGMIQFARPISGSYDLICLDSSASGREPPIVQLDHEAILVKDRTKVIKPIAPSFSALAESLIASGGEPVPFDS
jgi:hypothetical protein